MVYEWIKALHIISMVAWMAGIFYLPRLYVYPVSAASGSELSETLKVMERRLFRAIMNPAMISTFVFGIWMLALIPDYLSEIWMQVKLVCIFAMAGFHGFLARWRRQFDADANLHSENFYRVANEIPTILLIIIVTMAVVRPFSV